MKRYIKEFINMYSEKKSFLSKKRVESGLAFGIGQLGMIMFLIINYDTILISEVLMWATLEFTVSGYMLTHIQKEKIDKNI
tara:strand:+ start:443 stop:685 length:243 start_codon:yes stop_codon:yes gene_type:complete